MAIWESDLRKPPSRAEFSNRTCFLRRLSLNLFKNHILFGNRLWKDRFEHGDLRTWFEKTTFTSRILKQNVLFEEIKPQYTQKQHSFWKSALKRQIWTWWFDKTRISKKDLEEIRHLKPKSTQQNIPFGNLYIYIYNIYNIYICSLKFQIYQISKWWFEKTTFTSRILKRNVVLEEIKPESTPKPRSFWKSALKSQIWKWWFEKVIWENHLHKQNSQTERAFWGD